MDTSAYREKESTRPRGMQLMKGSSFSRLSRLAKGRIVGLREAGMERRHIRTKVNKKKDGKKLSLCTIDNVKSEEA